MKKYLAGVFLTAMFLVATGPASAADLADLIKSGFQDRGTFMENNTAWVIVQKENAAFVCRLNTGQQCSPLR